MKALLLRNAAIVRSVLPILRHSQSAMGSMPLPHRYLSQASISLYTLYKHQHRLHEHLVRPLSSSTSSNGNPSPSPGRPRAEYQHQAGADPLASTDATAIKIIHDYQDVFDANHDGVLTEAEIKAGKELIMKYDENKDGRLDSSEIATIRGAITAGIFGRTEWDMKVPEMGDKEQQAAFRRVLLGLNFAAILSNMDRVDMAIGIIPISQEMGWDKGTAGMVQSAFFQGFLLSQFPSGLLVNSLNARKLLMTGVVIWSAATALAPLAVQLSAGGTSYALPALCATRFLIGVGQGCVDASIVDTISRWSPTEERTRSSGYAFSGYNGGMVLGLLVGPWIIMHFGWPALFYAFGALGAVWCLWWAAFVLPLPHPEKVPASNVAMAKPLAGQKPGQQQQQAQWRSLASIVSEIPFKAILSNRSVQGLCLAHFIYGWGIFSLSSWLPTYITEVIGLNLSSSAFLALLPPVGGIVVGGFATATSDNLVRHGWSVTMVRRAAQVGCFVLPAACSLGAVMTSGVASLGLIMMGQAFHGLAMAGIWSSHADVSPKYAGLLASITSSCASVAGALSVACVGSLYKATGSWNLALVGPLIGMYTVGALAWTFLVVNEAQDFDKKSK